MKKLFLLTTFMLIVLTPSVQAKVKRGYVSVVWNFDIYDKYIANGFDDSKLKDLHLDKFKLTEFGFATTHAENNKCGRDYLASPFVRRNGGHFQILEHLGYDKGHVWAGGLIFEYNEEGLVDPSSLRLKWKSSLNYLIDGKISIKKDDKRIKGYTDMQKRIKYIELMFDRPDEDKSKKVPRLYASDKTHVDRMKLPNEKIQNKVTKIMMRKDVKEKLIEQIQKNIIPVVSDYTTKDGKILHIKEEDRAALDVIESTGPRYTDHIIKVKIP